MHVEQDPRPWQSVYAHPPPTRPYALPPTRRPLPTPRPRPESMPPPLRDALVVQAPAPSWPAAVLPSPTPRRPLPTPAPRHASIDLADRPAIPDRDLRIPSSFSRRTAPLPDPAAFSPPPPRPPGNPVMERRSTVSGAPPAQSSPPRRPLPSSPTAPPRVPSLHPRVPASSEDDRGPSSPLDMSDDEAYEPITFADPDRVVTPSPQYGIRDLPSRSRMAIASRPAPAPDSPASRPHSPQARPLTAFSQRIPPPAAAPQSLTLRFAAMGLAEERERQAQQSPAQSPTSPMRQQHTWSANMPPLPRAPRPLFGTADIPSKSDSTAIHTISCPE